MNVKQLIGKTIKRIEPDYWEGCVIEFTDGTRICLTTYEYPDGGYADTRVDPLDYDDWKEYCRVENKPINA